MAPRPASMSSTGSGCPLTSVTVRCERTPLNGSLTDNSSASPLGSSMLLKLPSDAVLKACR